MSEAWNYGVRNKHVVTFCQNFEDQLAVEPLTTKQAIIELIDQLEEGFPPESWHIVLTNLRFMLSENPS
jgi:hypothetical protein